MPRCIGASPARGWPAPHEEAGAVSLQPARKRSGMNAPSRANEKAHENGVVERNAAVRARRHASAFGQAAQSRVRGDQRAPAGGRPIGTARPASAPTPSAPAAHERSIGLTTPRPPRFSTCV